MGQPDPDLPNTTAPAASTDAYDLTSRQVSPRPTAVPRWLQRAATLLSGLVLGLLVNSISDNFTKGVASTAVAAVALLVVVVATQLRQLPPGAPIQRLVARTSLGAAAVTTLASLTAPASWQPWLVLGATGLALIGCLTPLPGAAARYLLLGVALIGAGVATIGLVVANVVDGGQLLVGLAGIGLGLSAIGFGVAVVMGRPPPVVVAGIGVGVATIGFGVVVVMGGQLLLGLSLIGVGVAAIGFGVAVMMGRPLLFGIAPIGLGVGAIGAGVAIVMGDPLPVGLAMIGVGVAAIALGVANVMDRHMPANLALIGLGLAAIGLGIAHVVVGQLLFGLALIGFGMALFGLGARVLVTESTVVAWIRALVSAPADAKQPRAKRTLPEAPGSTDRDPDVDSL